MKAKNKIAESTKKAKLYKEADRIIEKIETTGLKQDHIALKANLNPATLSRFLHKKEGYVTQSMVDRMNNFLESTNELEIGA